MGWSLSRHSVCGWLCLVLTCTLPCSADASGKLRPPPEFADPQRAPTGDNRLEHRILRSLHLEELTDLELRRLQEEALKTLVSDEVLSQYMAVLLARGELKPALNLLHRRAIAALDDDHKLADALGLAMGQLRWGACEQMARDYLARRTSSGAFLVFGLCAVRAGSIEDPRTSFEAASTALPMKPALIDELVTWTIERSGSGQLPSAPEELAGRLMEKLMQRGPLDRLFLQHLLGRFESRLPTGSLDLGGITTAEIRKIVLSRSRSYRYCYDLARRIRPRRPRLSGSQEFQFFVGPLGQVQGVEPADEGWGGHHAADDVNACLSQQLGRLRFPMPRYGFPQRARHQFSFSPD
ncbi:MAG TPA: hypothetical protein DIU15_01225 [Deltaproteobacteria bacterium]|nr:hypothetical protein [Deltaproteobacteria bacterium]HCP44647.1 hypothetical protein [Deltaproteobacteria bacterium]